MQGIVIFGPLLDRYMENILERMSFVFIFVSVYVFLCTLAIDYTFSPRKLIFGLSDPCDMRKKHIFSCFEILILLFLWACFDFCPYIRLVQFWFQTTGHSLSSRNVIFGVRELCTITSQFFFTIKVFWQFFNITLVILYIIASYVFFNNYDGNKFMTPLA